MHSLLLKALLLRSIFKTQQPQSRFWFLQGLQASPSSRALRTAAAAAASVNADSRAQKTKGEAGVMATDDEKPPIMFVNIPVTESSKTEKNSKRTRFDSAAKNGDDDRGDPDYEEENNAEQEDEYYSDLDEAAKMKMPLVVPVQEDKGGTGDSEARNEHAVAPMLQSDRLSSARLVAAAMKGAGVAPVISSAVALWAAHNNGQTTPNKWV